MKIIYIIIVVFNEKECTVRCLSELERVVVSGYGLRVVVVDNASSDGTGRILRKRFPKVFNLRNRKNIGFASAVNQGLRLALKDKSLSFVLLLNNDTYDLRPSFISKLITTALLNEEIGIVAPAIRHFIGKKLFYGLEGRLDLSLGKASHRNVKRLTSRQLIDANFVSGCCMLIKRSVIDKVGFFDGHYFLYLEDVDYCLSVQKAGFKIVLDPKVIISHKVSASLQSPLKKIPHSFKSNLRLISKWTPDGQKLRAYLYCFYFYPSLYLLWSARILKRKITGEKL